MRSAVVALILALAVPTAALPAGAKVKSPQSARTQLLALTNTERRAHHLRPLTSAADLTRSAQAHAERMARAGEIFHSGSLSRRAYRVTGENVGLAPTPQSINKAFLNSPTHAALIRHSGFTAIGIGIARARGQLYLVEQFGERARPAARAHTPREKPRVVDILLRLAASN